MVNSNSENGQTSVASSNTKKPAAEVNRRKSLQTKNSVDAPKQGHDNGNGVTDNGAVNGDSIKHAKLNRQSSAETSVDDVNNKLTSHAFQSYDEQEHLESKEIQSPTTEDIPT